MNDTTQMVAIVATAFVYIIGLVVVGCVFALAMVCGVPASIRTGRGGVEVGTQALKRPRAPKPNPKQLKHPKRTKHPGDSDKLADNPGSSEK